MKKRSISFLLCLIIVCTIFCEVIPLSNALCTWGGIPADVDKVLNDYIEDNFYEGMPIPEKMNALAKFPAQYDYNGDINNSTFVKMVRGEGGNCWASVGAILELCKRLNIEAYARDADHEGGTLHANVVVVVGKQDYYILDAGYSGMAPRYYSVHNKSTLFSYSSFIFNNQTELKINQYDGDLINAASMSIPQNIEIIEYSGERISYPVTAIAADFLDPETFVLPDFVRPHQVNIQKFFFPKTLRTIESNAFGNCTQTKQIYFCGDAPDIADNAFNNVTATVYYPKNNKTWTADVRKNYGGKLTWVGISVAEITKQPVSVCVSSGATAKTTVQATGSNLTYQWYLKKPGKTTFSKSSNTTDTYSCKMNATNDGRQVYCVITDEYGNQIQTDTVTISMLKSKAKIVSQPISVTVEEGEIARATVKATGDGLSYRWYYKDVGSSGYTYTPSYTGNTYSVTMNAARDGRQVLCRVYDKYSNMVQSNTVKLSMEHHVKITQQPKSVTVASGAIAKVTVKATGDGLSYRWYYKNPSGSGYTYTSSYTGSSYSVTMNAARDGRQVLCRVYDKYGNAVQTNTVKLSMEHYVKITQQPVSVTVAKGAIAKVTVKATGDGLTYRWYYKNPGDSSYTYSSSYTGNNYSVTMTAARAGRQVLCRVYDKYGNVVQTNAVTLNMR